MTKEDLLRRAREYARRFELTLGEQLGFGVHGIVLVAESQTKPGRSAIKVHEREPAYIRERDIYFRLRDQGVTELCGCHVPQFLQGDDELWVIRMTAVTRPHVLDFAGAYLDTRPDFSEEVIAEWPAEKEEQFGSSRGEVEAILWSLERLGIFLVDLSPSNIALEGYSADLNGEG